MAVNAFLFALVITGIAGFLDLVSFDLDTGFEPHLLGTSVAAVICLPMSFGLNLLILFESTPTMSGMDIFIIPLVDIVVAFVVFGIANIAGERFSLGSVPLLVVSLLALMVIGIWNEWPLGNLSNKLAHVAQVTNEPVKAYPPTDDNHMVVVSDQNALNKADQAMSQNIPGSNVTIGSRYKLRDCVLQSVDAHMYYICGLQLGGSANNTADKYTVPGFIVVDAEDPNVAPQARLTYHMVFTPGAPYGHSIDRLIYSHGYSSYFIDDLTLEVNDQWQPYYTASINRPGVRMQQAIPVGFITVNPQNGKIQRYGLNQIPSWVDRVYSARMAKSVLNWWGEWATVNWSHQGSGGRYHVDGNVTLVYTTNGPAWQALMTSFGQDTSISYIALMDTRSTQVRLYRAPEGLQTQSKVVEAINTSKSNLKGLDPVNMALHEIYGELVWVAPLVPNGTAGAAAESSAGLALLSATDPNSADVIIGTDKADALSQLSAQIATGDNNVSPEANSNLKSVSGTIAAVNQVMTSGNSYIIMELKGDTSNIYRGQITGSTFGNLQMSLAHVGDQVTLHYVDTGSPVRNITSFSDASLSGASS